MDSILFTPASLIDLLSKISELSEYEIGISETIDGNLQLTIGDSVYDIDIDQANDIRVEDSVVDQVEEVNQEAYQELDDSIEVQVSDEAPVESGILKEIAKSLLLGGMIRLSKKLLS